MRKTLSVFLLSLLLFSCSGYFGQGDMKEGGGVSPLAISGGGYLSSDTANEITPFLFRDPNTGKAYLFFSSDRNGTYNLFYAQMNADGSFNSPVEMDTNVNSISNEVSPVVFQAYTGYNSTNYYYISFIRYLGTQTNVVTYRLINYPPSFNAATFPVSSIMNTNASGLGLSDKQSMNPTLEFSFNQTNWQEIIWYSANMPEGWTGTSFSRLSGSSTLKIVSLSFGFEYPGGTNYLFSSLFLGKYQLLLAGITSVTNFNSTIPRYASVFNDKNPFVDKEDGYKVYFSSDRFNKGNFDLYRYNLLTFDKVIP